MSATEDLAALYTIQGLCCLSHVLDNIDWNPSHKVLRSPYYANLRLYLKLYI